MENALMRQLARDMYLTGVAAADPAGAVRKALLRDPMGGRPVVLALGKAAVPMMKEALRHVTPEHAIAVTNAENFAALDGAEVLVGAHPVPDAGSLHAGRALLDAVKGLRADQEVLALISGGGSALAIAPVDGVHAEDKQAANEVLLASGLDINQMNLVRQCLSRFKGGGLARATDARMRALILSDVIGDDLRVVASGPTVGRVGSPEQAKAVLQEAGVWDRMPQSVRAHLQLDLGSTQTPVVRNEIIGSNRVSLEAMRDSIEGAVIVNDRLEGDVAAAAAEVLAAMRQAKGDCTLIFGGETTVKLRGDGLGGRNQELALRVAAGAQDLGDDWVFLSGGTDGRDGPTDAAGGLVDGGTIGRLDRSFEEVLANNDSYHGLKSSGDLLITGGTGTNVADVQIFLRRS